VFTVGISGSGKSTFAKQLKIITDTLTPEEINNYKVILLKNIIIGIQELIKYSEKLEFVIAPENRKHSRFFKELLVWETEWTSKIGERVQILWEDPAIQSTWNEIPNYQFQVPNLDFLLENVHRYVLPHFVPTNEDILCARFRTTGTQLTKFVRQKYQWEIIDIGGQRPERLKWRDIIKSGVDCVIYFSALDEYNMLSVEEKNKTKMQLSLEVFEEVVKDLKNICLILFLNKVDLFTKKINQEKSFSEFQNIFPEYRGGQDLPNAIDYIKDLFLSKTSYPEDINVHTISTLDTQAIYSAFGTVKDHIWKTRMEQAISAKAIT